MALKYERDNHQKLVKDEKIVNHPEGQGLVKRSGKVDSILTNRKGLINGPPVAKQDPDADPRSGPRSSAMRSKKGILRR